MPQDQIKVTTHVGRDLLASAAAFKNEATVVWEYVVNSLQYVERGVVPKVQVRIKPRQGQIEILDNGYGMDQAGLAHFFQMHGENKDRQAGRPGRGKFGTGKSAAFGIGTTLRVEARRNRLRNVVELTRSAVDASSGSNIPIEWLIRNEETDQPNGTTVTVSGILLPRLDTTAVIGYVERHLQAWRKLAPEVAVNDHLCTYREPAVAAEYSFLAPDAFASLIGDVTLAIQVSQAPLPESDQGVLITAGAGNLVAIEKAGIERKEFGSYLFGSVDVPNLETHKSPIEPYDSSRSLVLNAAHPVSAALMAFIGSKLEEVRQRLVTESRELRRTEQARKLASEASKIAEILNRDFREVHKRLQDIRSASVPGDANALFGGSGMADADLDEWIAGAKEPGTVPTSIGGRTGGGAGRPAPFIPAAGERDPKGNESVDPAGGRGARRKPTGGFHVEFKGMGREEKRSLYDPGALTILINLDHPVVAAALGDGVVEDVQFKRLAYEIAFSEYAIATGWETAQTDPDVPADELLYDIRETLNRVSIAAASLYRN